MRKLLTIFSISLLSVAVPAQRNEISIGESSLDITIGPSTLFLGDIGDPFVENYFFKNDRDDQQVLANSLISVGFHQLITDRWAYKVSVHSGIYDRKDANYAFHASVFELSGRFEYSLFTTYFPKLRSLYVFGGLGFLYSGYVNDRLIAPRRTIPGSIVAPVIPVGLGYKHEVFNRFSIGAEFDVHYTLSDMLEGKKGGMPHDALSTLSIVLSYQIFKGNRRIENCNCNW